MMSLEQFDSISKEIAYWQDIADLGNEKLNKILNENIFSFFWDVFIAKKFKKISGETHTAIAIAEQLINAQSNDLHLRCEFQYVLEDILTNL